MAPGVLLLLKASKPGQQWTKVSGVGVEPAYAQRRTWAACLCWRRGVGGNGSGKGPHVHMQDELWDAMFLIRMLFGIIIGIVYGLLGSQGLQPFLMCAAAGACLPVAVTTPMTGLGAPLHHAPYLACCRYLAAQWFLGQVRCPLLLPLPPPASG